jgi:CheY-like chemotaxis protein
MLRCFQGIFKKKICTETSCDFSAYLECKKIKGKWKFMLCNMKGNMVESIVGKTTKRIELSKLMLPHIAEQHNIFLSDILEKESGSEYWNSLLDGKMQRSVQIQNPFNNKKYDVKLKMVIMKKRCDKIIFDVKFSDITSVMMIENEAKLLTHDLCAIFRSTITTLELLKNECDEGNRTNLCAAIDMLAREGINLCTKTRDVILLQSIAIDTEKTIKVYIAINDIIHMLNALYPNVVKCSCVCNLTMNNNSVNALKHLLFNIIKNAVESNVTHVVVKVSQKFNTVEITVNVPTIISNEYVQSEGMTLSINRWKTFGGILYIHTYNDNMMFNIEIIGQLTPDYALLCEQLEMLEQLPQKKTILFVDDSVVNIKMLAMMMFKWLKLTDISLKIITSNWDSVGLYICDNFTDANLIFTSNGEYAYDIYRLIHCDTVVADLEMPVMNGYDLIKNILTINKDQHIVINSATSEETFYQIMQQAPNFADITFLTKGVNTNIAKILKL